LSTFKDHFLSASDRYAAFRPGSPLHISPGLPGCALRAELQPPWGEPEGAGVFKVALTWRMGTILPVSHSMSAWLTEHVP